MEQGGPKAPKDAQKKRAGFYIMRNKQVAGSAQPDGKGVQFLYQNDGRMLNSARIVGNVQDEEILKLMVTTEGFRKLVHSIGVTVEGEDPTKTVEFVFQMYGNRDVYGSGTQLTMPVKADGFEQVLNLAECEWSDDDNILGQIRFVFPHADEQAKVSVRLYVQDGFSVPEPEEEGQVDLSSPYYGKMVEKSLMQMGNTHRLKRAIDKAKRGEDVTIAFIGGSITQGAGAVPINRECYAYKTFLGLCKLAGKGEHDNIHYVKAGVGGTPSELGMLRYERDVLKDGAVQPDIVVVEFAVNDEGDETKGECYEALVRKIWAGASQPAVVLIFAVFANDWNLQERLGPVGVRYQLPMVSTLDMVVEQFYKKTGEGKVVSKNQFFYDSYHPTNVGHTLMADGLIHLFEVADKNPAEEEELDILSETPYFSADFEKVCLMDKKNMDETVVRKLDCGDFTETDTELQQVERDYDLTTTPQFPYNWMHKGGSRPFSMDIVCSRLLLIFKDSASNGVGRAQVYVDGELTLNANPAINGWTHCNPLICFRAQESGLHHVEVRMEPGMEDKEFTILGFGYVK